jgi:glyoxylase-like metal-dependent hydrolase (beta-lactamase superfamily II)
MPSEVSFDLPPDRIPDSLCNSAPDGVDRATLSSEVKPDAVKPDAAKPESPGKPPRLVCQTQDSPEAAIFAFPPNRDTLGGTAYLIVEESNILVDCPAWNPTNQAFLEAQGGVDWLFLTHRGGMGNAKAIQTAFDCKILVQEQEAYLLPGLAVTSFQQTFPLSAQSQVLWTAGHSPGSACLYYSGMGGVLFSGRHLLPTPQGTIAPIKMAKTFHWPRQLRQVQVLIDRFTPDTLQIICPGANLGFLRGQLAIESAYEQLVQLDQGGTS